ncbi:hypothetical protein K7432_000664 [Basidiobolus ranarum]|uniref:54S ribosomal protein L31, mitochondrial n=1 Tax=Basidiobolus ranarum TaxID=34480 RepID=A0ABR2X4A0_9FUNG
MFGAFRSTLVAQGGLLWKVPFRLSKTRKANVRKRLRAVDDVIQAVSSSGVECKALDTVQKLPRCTEMSKWQKYTVFSKKFPGHRKPVHKVQKFTKTPIPREYPEGFL